MKTEVIHEDKDILVIYKPAGLATQTAKIGQPDVVSELKNYLMGSNPTKKGQLPYLGVIHRLDQPVEGLLVFAKNKAAATNLTAQLQRQDEGGLNKHYYAMVCGKPSANEGELVDYMYKDKDNRAVIVESETGKHQNPDVKSATVQCNQEIKKAVLKYHVMESGELSRGGVTVDLTKLDIEILTGRFHQIRAQMSHAGLPLLGDAKYGSEASKAQAKQCGVQNVALCAYKLILIHPTTKKKMQFEIEPKGKAFTLL